MKYFVTYRKKDNEIVLLSKDKNQTNNKLVDLEINLNDDDIEKLISNEYMNKVIDDKIIFIDKPETKKKKTVSDLKKMLDKEISQDDLKKVLKDIINLIN